MSGFHRQRLRQLRRAAGLDPMPAFYSPETRYFGDPDWLYIDSRYFRPEALRWADEVVEFRAQGGRLSPQEEECFGRVWEAMRVGHKPTPGQEAKFKRRLLLRYAERLMPILLQREMKRRGIYYGPDAELPDDVELPSARELLFRHIAAEFGTTKGAAKVAFYRWRREVDGTH